MNAYASMLHYAMMAAPEQAVDSAHHTHGDMEEESSSDTGHHNPGGATDAACCHAVVCPVGTAAIPTTSFATPLNPSTAAQACNSTNLAAGLQHTPLLRPPR